MSPLSSISRRIDFGDGSATDWQSSRNASHSYPDEGHYTALVQVRDDAGAVASAARELGETCVDIGAVVEIPDGADRVRYR